MSLENYTGNISDLVATNPTGTDPRSQGDDHLRGIKYTLKQSFPLATGPVRVSGDKLFAGDSADNTKNFVIDASADNGTMKLARESGQDIMTVGADGKVTFPQNVQTWKNVTASRALNTGYTNTTGHTITVHVILQNMAVSVESNFGGRIGVGGNSVSLNVIAIPPGPAALQFVTLTASVPPGQAYGCDLQFNADLASWYELSS